MSFNIRIYRNRTRDYTVTLYEADGTTELSLAASDVVRMKIGSDGATPLLDLDSIDATPAGSKVTFTPSTGDCTVRLAQGDVNGLSPGAYDCEILVIDNSETAPADAAKHAEYGVLFVHPTMGGDLGEEESSSSGESEQSESSSLNSSSSSSS